MNVETRAVCDPCPECGGELIGLGFLTVRVNLGSLVSKGGLHTWPTCHKVKGGCGYTMPTDVEVTWRLEPDSAAKVEAARDKIRARRKRAA